MNDYRINYGSYYEDVFTMDTQYTLNETESEFSYINNVKQFGCPGTQCKL